jgi:hypothetical protein
MAAAQTAAEATFPPIHEFIQTHTYTRARAHTHAAVSDKQRRVAAAAAAAAAATAATAAAAAKVGAIVSPTAPAAAARAATGEGRGVGVEATPGGLLLRPLLATLLTLPRELDLVLLMCGDERLAVRRQLLHVPLGLRPRALLSRATGCVCVRACVEVMLTRRCLYMPRTHRETTG